MSDDGITHLAQFRQLELELVGPILGVLQGFFETLRTVVAFNLFLELADAAARRVGANFAWAAAYNLVAVLFAAGAFVGARILPAYAGLGEVVSVLPVVVVALQLKWFKPSALAAGVASVSA